MSKKILPLIAMLLLSGPSLAAQPSQSGDLGAPQVLPILEFVVAIEDGGYASYNLPVVNDYAPLDFAAYLYITQPLRSAENTIGTPLEQTLIVDLESFNNYWILSGPSASLFTTSPLGTGAADLSDTPQITAHYITNQLSNAELTQNIKAPEMSANGAAGALTLFVGAVFVLFGRRPATLLA
jgi:hypothetical protein